MKSLVMYLGVFSLAFAFALSPAPSSASAATATAGELRQCGCVGGDPEGPPGNPECLVWFQEGCEDDEQCSCGT